MRLAASIFAVLVFGQVFAQPQTLGQLWTVTSGEPGTFQRLGGGTITGFAFDVVAGPAGELPLLQRATTGNGVRLYRRVDATRYALAAFLLHDLNHPSERSGLLLRPGAYVADLGTPAEPKSMWVGTQILAGTLLSATQQEQRFRLTPGATYTNIFVGVEQVSGFAFSVAARGDGALPVIDFRLCDFNLSNRFCYFYKRGADSNWHIYAMWDSFGPPAPGLRFTPGDYLFQVASPSTPLPSPSLYRYMTMFSGSWLIP